MRTYICVDTSRRPLKCDIDKCVEDLSDPAKWNVASLRVDSGDYGDGTSTLWIGNGWLSLDDASVKLDQELVDQLLPMMNDIYKMCDNSPEGLLRNETANIPREQFPIVRKLGEKYVLLEHPRGKVRKFDYSTAELNSMINYLNGDFSEVHVKGGKLRSGGRDLLIDYGFADEWAFHGVLVDDVKKANAINEMTRVRDELLAH